MTDCRGFRSPVHRWGDWLWIEEWMQLGEFASQPIRVQWHPFCEGLKEVGYGTHAAHNLNLSPAHWKPHSPWEWQPETLVCFGPFLFSWLPTTLSEEISLTGNPFRMKACEKYKFLCPYYLLLCSPSKSHWKNMFALKFTQLWLQANLVNSYLVKLFDKRPDRWSDTDVLHSGMQIIVDALWIG